MAVSESTSILPQALILLSGAVVAAPLFKRLGLGTVLGYLAAGIVIGPVAGLVTDGEGILHFAELGVVMLLFVIGLELKPARLWALRLDIFGLGMLQVVLSGGIIALLISLLPQSNWQTALLVGLGLALSSTAFAMQLLGDRGERNSAYGEKSFAILLFQDIAIVPLLAVIPLLAPRIDVDNIFDPTQFALAVFAMLVLVLSGKFLLNPIFRLLAKTSAHEVMLAAALLLVLGAGALIEYAGMSMAMGAFIAGVMLAESSFRHELEANIEPFRGILLGLFFMAVGLSLDISAVAANWWIILLATPLLMLIKGAVIYTLSRLFGAAKGNALRSSLLLSQHGEFAFVLFSAAAASQILSSGNTAILFAIVTLSMALTPLCVEWGNRLLTAEKEEVMDENFEGSGGRVLIIGFGRFGQFVAQMLLAEDVSVTVIDASAERIRIASKFGFRVYYGNGTRLEVLRAAGLERADILVVTAGKQHTNKVIDLVKQKFPQIKIFARSYDRQHTIELLHKEVDFEIRETLHSAMEMGRAALEALNFDHDLTYETLEFVKQRDLKRLAIQQSEGLYAGAHLPLSRKVEAQPLVDPKRESKALTEQTTEALSADD